MSNPSIEEVSFVGSPDLTHYPPLLLLYGGGLAAIAAKDYGLLSSLLSNVTIASLTFHRQRVEERAARLLTALWDFREIFRVVAGTQSNVAVSDYLYKLLRNPLRAIEPDDRRYDKLFDRFEYLSAICYGDMLGGRDMPIGRFGRQFWYEEAGNILNTIEAELEKYGDNSPPLKGGICGGSIERFRKWKQQLYESLEKEERGCLSKHRRPSLNTILGIVRAMRRFLWKNGIVTMVVVLMATRTCWPPMAP